MSYIDMSVIQNYGYGFLHGTFPLSLYSMFLMCVCACAHGHACGDQECGSYEIWHRGLQNLNRILSEREICSYGFLVDCFPFFFFPLPFPYIFLVMFEIKKGYASR